MIQFATGVAFLMSSLYGASTDKATLTASAADSLNTNNNPVIENSTSKTTDKNSVEEYIRKEFADNPIMIDVARCESNYHQFDKEGKVIRGRVNPSDIGVLQINEKYHADDAMRLKLDIYTTEGNVAFGKYLYSKYGTSPWVHSSKCWNKDLANK